MAIKINGKDLAKRIINGQEVQKVMLNGAEIRPNEVPPVDDYLCFTANTSGSTLQLHSTVNWKNTALEISYDKETWQSYTIDPLNHYPLITLSNVGDKVYFRNQSTTPVVFSELSQYNNTYYYFTMSGSIAASGDINYLLCKETTTTLTGSGCYLRLFSDCSSLTSAPKLPATTLTESCYEVMFRNCGLTSAPELPATTLARLCYSSMFEGCSSLTTASELPAMTLAIGCYGGMFNGCTSLTTLPELPATTLASTCYYSMFRNCSGIKLSETQTGEYQTPYRIPSSGTGSDSGAISPLQNMFVYTGGTFAGTPTINQTYYTSNTIIS